MEVKYRYFGKIFFLIIATGINIKEILYYEIIFTEHVIDNCLLKSSCLTDFLISQRRKLKQHIAHSRNKRTSRVNSFSCHFMNSVNVTSSCGKFFIIVVKTEIQFITLYSVFHKKQAGSSWVILHIQRNNFDHRMHHRVQGQN